MVTEEIREAFNNYLDTVEKLVSDNIRFKQALEEIRNYCSRIEQGSVIASQDCLTNSIKNVVNYALQDEALK